MRRKTIFFLFLGLESIMLFAQLKNVKQTHFEAIMVKYSWVGMKQKSNIFVQV